MSFAAHKMALRRAVHTAFSVQATYQDSQTILPIELSIRWHNKQRLVGQLDSGGYAEFIEGVERIVFDMQELNDKGLDPARGGVLSITAPEYTKPDGTNYSFALQVADEDTGPVERIWQVTSL